MQSRELDFALLSNPTIPAAAVRAAAISLRYHPTFESIIFGENVAPQVFESLQYSDFIHTMRAHGLWSSSLLDFAAALPVNSQSALQVFIFIFFFFF